MSDVQIDFNNIESLTLRQLGKDLMEDLVELCPSDAAVRATFRLVRGRFLADIKIASSSGLMRSFEQGAAFKDLLEDVKSQLMGQIVQWRSRRFGAPA